MTAIGGRSFFCSWSGGKDSCLAFYRAVREGGSPSALLTVFREDGARSRSHGLPVGVIERQAQALGVPLVACRASWADYETRFLSALHRFKRDGIDWGIFGDIDLEPHLEWVERVCASAGVRPYEPLWKCERRALLEAFLNLGFKAVVIAVKEGALDKGFLGRTLSPQVVVEMEEEGIDASGEEGEYHTVVTDGPIFSSPIRLEIGDQVVRDGYRFLDVSLR